jgi:hypothetical protein
MHGVEVSGRDGGGRGADGPRVRRVRVSHEDGGAACFVPERGEEFFTLDDAHRVVEMLRAGSEVLEWGLASAQRDPAAGPDKGGGSA